MRNFGVKLVHIMLTLLKTLIDTNEISRMDVGKAPSSISYIDFGQAVLPRLYPSKNRIHDDIEAQYGLEILLAFVQMLMNESSC
jgi:hypothetical protein